MGRTRTDGSSEKMLKQSKHLQVQECPEGGKAVRNGILRTYREKGKEQR